MAVKRRERWIDLVKCIAIFLVLLNHSGIVIPGVNFWGGMFFVPVFFVLSGYTYYTREESYALFLKRKAKRLLLPYITANGILFLFFLIKDTVLGSAPFQMSLHNLYGIAYARNQIFAQGSQTLFLPVTEKRILLMSILNSPTWFLPALFLTMVFFELLLRLTDRNGRKMCFIAVLFLFVAILYHYLFPVLLPWSLDAVPFFLLFFLWGYFLRRKAFLYYLIKQKWIIAVGVVAFVASALVNGSANFSIADYGRSVVLALYNAIISSTFVMYLCYKLRKHIPAFLAATGTHTLIILCYHLLVFAVMDVAFAIALPFLNQTVAAILKIVISMAVLSILPTWTGRMMPHRPTIAKQNVGEDIEHGER